MKFLSTVLVTAIVLFLLNAVVYVVFLDDFFQSHPAVSKEFARQLYRPNDQVIWWAIITSGIAMGFLVTTVIHWSGSRTFKRGLLAGLIFGILLLCSVDFGLLGSTNNFTTAGALADLCCSTTTITISSGVAGWMLGIGKKTAQKSARRVAVEAS
jgi:uncharacterized membrane protein